MSPEALAAIITAMSGTGVGALGVALVGWWRARRRAPLDVAQLAQDVAARAIEHARRELAHAYQEAEALRAELAEARTEIARLTTEVTHLSSLLGCHPSDT